MKHHLIATLVLSSIASWVGAAHSASNADSAASANAANKTTSGIAVEYIDPSVRPQDDMFNHVNGKWLATTEIPADKSSWGTDDKLNDDVQQQLRAIVEGAAAHQASDPEVQRIGDFYSSYMDEARLEALGLTPLKADLARVAALTSRQQIPELIAYFNRNGYTAPYRLVVRLDAKDSSRYAATLLQSGLSLPDPDYYLKPSDRNMADTLDRFQKHVARMLSLAGNSNAEADSKTIVALETKLAKIQWSKVQLRDSLKTYNRVPLGQLSTLAPHYDWNGWMRHAGIVGKVDSIIVGQPSFITGFDRLLNNVPLSAWKAYFEWQVLHANAAYLGKDFALEDFAFYGTVLSGIKSQPPRWQRALNATDDALSESLGKLYVAQYFPPERKARMEALVKNVLEAFKQSIGTLDWMSPATKEQARIKLSKFAVKLGYPNKWRDYSRLVVIKDDLVGNVARANAFEYDRQIAKLGKPVDRDEWILHPQMVNAVYFASLNEIEFPAAILQAPIFTPDADDAVNYGAIGATIGHEISHGFDDQGARYDGDGNLRDWWTEADHKNFADKTRALIQQYNAFSPIKGYHVNGELTLGENIADNSGAAIAYKAYQISLGGKPSPVIDGLTGEQRFYLGFGQQWRAKTRDAQQIVYLKSDPHSPEQFRVNGTLSNQPGFYEAFGVKPGDKMYVAPELRVNMW